MPLFRVGPFAVITTDYLDRLEHAAGRTLEVIDQLTLEQHAVEQRDHTIAVLNAEVERLVVNLATMFGRDVVAAACAHLGIR